MRMAGFSLQYLQERRNLASMRQKGTYRILCLGESTTADMVGVASYPSQLETILNDKNIGIKFSVINKGLFACDTTGIISRLEENLDQYKPDMVVVMMGVNDFGPHMKYAAASLSGNRSFLTSLQTYKLLKWIRQGLIIKHSGERSFYLTTIKEANAQSINNTASLADKDEMELGYLYMKQGRWNEAEVEFKKAIKKNPLNEKAYYE